MYKVRCPIDETLMREDIEFRDRRSYHIYNCSKCGFHSDSSNPRMDLAIEYINQKRAELNNLKESIINEPDNHSADIIKKIENLERICRVFDEKKERVDS